MFEVVRTIVERKNEPGAFEVFDGAGTRLGVLDFAWMGEFAVTVESPWGDSHSEADRREDR